MKNWEKEFDKILVNTPVSADWDDKDLENAVKQFIQNLLDKQKEEIKEKANAYDEDGEPVKIFWS